MRGVGVIEGLLNADKGVHGGGTGARKVRIGALHETTRADGDDRVKDGLVRVEGDKVRKEAAQRLHIRRLELQRRGARGCDGEGW